MIKDYYNNTSDSKDLENEIVYQVFTDKETKKEFSVKKVITESFNFGFGGYAVGKKGEYRLLLNGVKSNFTAQQKNGVWYLSHGISLEPVGELR